MRNEEVTLIREASDLLDRLRRVRTRFRANWVQLDDLPEGAEEDLRTRLTSAFRGWASNYNIDPVPETGLAIDCWKAELYEVEDMFPPASP